MCVTTPRRVSYQRFTLFSQMHTACQQLGLPTADPTIKLRVGGCQLVGIVHPLFFTPHTHTHTHTRVNYDASLLFYFPVHHSTYFLWTHTHTHIHPLTKAHLRKLCQNEVNLHLALSTFALRRNFFQFPLPKSSQLPWLCSADVCVWVCVCGLVYSSRHTLKRASFILLPFVNQMKSLNTLAAYLLNMDPKIYKIHLQIIDNIKCEYCETSEPRTLGVALPGT